MTRNVPSSDAPLGINPHSGPVPRRASPNGDGIQRGSYPRGISLFAIQRKPSGHDLKNPTSLRPYRPRKGITKRNKHLEVPEARRRREALFNCMNTMLFPASTLAPQDIPLLFSWIWQSWQKQKNALIVSYQSSSSPLNKHLFPGTGFPTPLTPWLPTQLCRGCSQPSRQLKTVEGVRPQYYPTPCRVLRTQPCCMDPAWYLISRTKNMDTSKSNNNNTRPCRKRKKSSANTPALSRPLDRMSLTTNSMKNGRQSLCPA